MNISMLPPEIQQIIRSVPQRILVQIPTDTTKLVFPPDADEKIAAFKEAFKALGSTLIGLDPQLARLDGQMASMVERLPGSFAKARRIPLDSFRELLDDDLARVIEVVERLEKDADPLRKAVEEATAKLDALQDLVEQFEPSQRRIEVIVTGEEADAEALGAAIAQFAVAKGREAQEQGAKRFNWIGGKTRCCKDHGFNPPEGSPEFPVHHPVQQRDCSSLPPGVQMLLSFAQKLEGVQIVFADEAAAEGAESKSEPSSGNGDAAPKDTVISA